MELTGSGSNKNIREDVSDKYKQNNFMKLDGSEGKVTKKKLE
jgi:hypothetical protein